jgi:hypothetical protein
MLAYLQSDTRETAMNSKAGAFGAVLALLKEY